MLRNSDTGYGLVAIAFHWVIALMFLGQVGLGLTMTRLELDDPLVFPLYQWHKSIGLAILLLALLRLAWRLTGPVPKLPAAMAGWEKSAARLAHVALYAALIAIPLTGWALVSASPLNIPTFAFNLVVVPHLPVPVSDTSEASWTFLHGVLAKAALAVAVVHVAAALRHEFILRDGLLSRIVRPAGR